MNILHLNQNLSVSGGGISRMIRDFAPELSRRGVNVFCATGEKLEKTPDGIRHFYLPAVNSIAAKKEQWEASLNEILSDFHIDLIHVHEVKNLEMVRFLVRKIPVVIHLHNYGWWCPGNDLFYASSNDICPLSTSWKCIPYAYFKRCNNRHPKRLIPSVRNGFQKKQIWNENVHFITSSTYMRNRAFLAGIKREKISIVPYAVNQERFNGSAGKPVGSLKPGFILFAGRFSQSKGIEYLIDAYSYISGFGVELVLTGDGSHRPMIEQHIRRLNLQDKVRLLGWRGGQELSWLFKNCSLLAVPSIWDEVFGIIGLEAMAAGKPVVAFDVGGISQWLDDNVTGYLAKRKNIRELSDKMADLLKNPETAERMGQAGRDKFYREFTTETQTENLLRVYDEAVRARTVVR